jgi:hypothetical protein
MRRKTSPGRESKAFGSMPYAHLLRCTLNLRHCVPACVAPLISFVHSRFNLDGFLCVFMALMRSQRNGRIDGRCSYCRLS